jgi:hypothetical protein
MNKMDIDNLCMAFVMAINLIRSGRENLVKQGACFSEDGYWKVEVGDDYVVLYGNNEGERWILGLYTLPDEEDEEPEEVDVVDRSYLEGKDLEVQQVLLQKIHDHLNDGEKIELELLKGIQFFPDGVVGWTKPYTVELNQQNIFKILDLNRLFCLHCVKNKVKTAVAGMPDDERIPLEKDFYEAREKFIMEHWESWEYPNPDDWYAKTFEKN